MTLQVAADQRVAQLSHHIRKEKKLVTANCALTKENEVLAKDVLKAYAANRKVQQKNEQLHTEIVELQEALRIARLPGNSANSSRPLRPICISLLEIRIIASGKKQGKKQVASLGMPVRHYCLTG